MFPCAETGTLEQQQEQQIDPFCLQTNCLLHSHWWRQKSIYFKKKTVFTCKDWKLSAVQWLNLMSSCLTVSSCDPSVTQLWCPSVPSVGSVQYQSVWLSTVSGCLFIHGPSQSLQRFVVSGGRRPHAGQRNGQWVISAAACGLQLHFPEASGVVEVFKNQEAVSVVIYLFL